MNRFPCKKCPKCGLYHDFTVGACSCGKKLAGIEAQFVDTDALTPEQRGSIDTSRRIFVQKCSACGAMNYTDDGAKPVRVCFNCHKTRIAAIAPVPYVEEDGSGDEAEEEKAPAAGGQTSRSQPVPPPDPEDDEDDDASVQWQGILGNIRKTVGDTPKETPDRSGIADRSDAGASGVRGGAPAAASKQSPAPVRKDLTLTAVRYGRLSFTVRAGQCPYMLGRSANQGAFLSQDGRVGNEHCFLTCRNGTWFVKDNHSSNGTAVNARDIGLDGEYQLSDGDELKLGHHPDSMAFRISIG